LVYWWLATVVADEIWIFGKEKTTISVFVWMPILTTVYEIGAKQLLSRGFVKFQDNDLGIIMATIFMYCDPEVARLLSFILLCLDGSPVEIFLNVLFSVCGEIWVHTQVGFICCNEIEYRLRGTLLNDFAVLRKIVSSTRSYLDYVVLIWFFAVLHLRISLDGPQAGLTQVTQKQWYILGGYLLQEFAAKVVCHSVRKRSGYKRISAVGHLKLHIQLMMVVAFFTFYNIKNYVDALKLLRG